MRLFKFATYCTGDYVWHALVAQIGHIVAAKQTAGDRVARNSNRALIASEMHAAVDHTAFERKGHAQSAWTGVAYPDSSVDDVTLTVYFFGAENKIRGPVRDEPAVDRGG